VGQGLWISQGHLVDHYFLGLMARTLSGSVTPKTNGVFLFLVIKEFMTVRIVGSFFPFVKLLKCPFVPCVSRINDYKDRWLPFSIC
jgi:hypothetical protein